MITRSAEPLWRRAVLRLGATFEEAISCLDSSSLQIVLVVKDDLFLVGTLTDGDIRRAFLGGATLNSKIDPVVNRTPMVVPPDIDRESALQIMKSNRVHQLPVVSISGQVVDLHVWDSVVQPAIKENLMVVMAGGKGVRMLPYTESCPKPMLVVGGKPILQRILERAREDGFLNFAISVHYLGDVIESYFGDGTSFGVSIKYLREDSPLGTAGCLGLLPERPESPLVVTNGDVLTGIRYSEMLDFHERCQAVATMAVRQYEIRNQFGVVKTKGVDFDGFEEKPVYRSQINAGVYVLSPEALSLIEPGHHCDMPTLFDRVLKSGSRAVVYPVHESWLDVGRPDDYILANETVDP